LAEVTHHYTARVEPFCAQRVKPPAANQGPAAAGAAHEERGWTGEGPLR
jgi:hypothetical protein